MRNDFRIAINQICNERRLPKEVVVEAIEAALVSAYKKNFGTSQNIRVKIDPDTGKVRVFVVRDIVDKVQDPRTQISLAEARKLDAMAELGGEIEQEVTPRNFGRIAAQTAKQVILQRIREAERDVLYSQYAEREGEIINGTVRNIDEYGNVILSLGKTEAILQRNERIPNEDYRPGQRLRTYVVEVQKSSRGPQIVVSRTRRQFLKRLLELEVPEIFNGTVEIKAIAREPGSRSKVAVAALQEGVDPVGSCVGVRGVRIQNVVNELNGEKIDVVAWSSDPAVFVANALSPAKVAQVDIDEESKTATVVVPDNQLSLAIGKEGQNARLAAKLTGWRIDIKSVSEAAVEAERKAEEEAAAALLAAEKEAARAAALALLEEAEALIAQEEGEDEGSEVAATPLKETTEQVEATTIQSEAEKAGADAAELPAESMIPEELELSVEEVALSKDSSLSEPSRPEPVPIEDLSLEEDWFEEDEDEEFEEDRRQRSKKEKRRKKRMLVYDERIGQVVSKRKRKPGRTPNVWDSNEWDDE